MLNRRHSAIAALAAAAMIVGVTACGNEVAGSGSKANPQPSASPSVPQMSVPVTLHRSGGFAGFNDVVTVDPDGKATLKVGRNGKAFNCNVSDVTMQSIRDQVGKAQAAGLPKAKGKPGLPTKGGADLMNYSIKIGEQSYRLSDGETIPTEIRPLFAAMSDVLNSAKALSSNTKPANGTYACK